MAEGQSKEWAMRSSERPLKPNPFMSYRDPLTGKWLVIKPESPNLVIKSELPNKEIAKN